MSVYTYYTPRYIRINVIMVKVLQHSCYVLYTRSYIRQYVREAQMKTTRRSDSGKSGHLLISVPANRVIDVEAALNFLEARRQKRGSQVVIELIIAAARRNGWRRSPNDAESAQ